MLGNGIAMDYSKLPSPLDWEFAPHREIEGLKVPQKQPTRGRLWLDDGFCIRLRPLRPNNVWSRDFVMDRTDDGRPIKMLTLLDEFTRESLAIVPARRIRASDVIDIFADVMIERWRAGIHPQ